MRKDAAGFSLIEVMVAMAIMLLISGAAVSALLKMTSTQATIWNRTQMHSGIRGATEVLQQEVGQAGRVAIPNTVTLAGAVGTGSQTVTLQCSGSCLSGTTPVSGLFVGENLTIDTGSDIETVALTGVNTVSNQITATFTNLTGHATGAVVRTFGGFSAGIVPPAPPIGTYTNGSTGDTLKLFGDINGDGKMVYIEYYCDTTNHNLYRNSMDWDATSKTAPSASQILLSNITSNPGGTSCFTYQTSAVQGTTYVTDVAITLTVQTQVIDPVTKQYQTETKALLNVSPRNVFSAWEMHSLGISYRIQPIPPGITTNLLAALP